MVASVSDVASGGLTVGFASSGRSLAVGVGGNFKVVDANPRPVEVETGSATTPRLVS